MDFTCSSYSVLSLLLTLDWHGRTIYHQLTHSPLSNFVPVSWRFTRFFYLFLPGSPVCLYLCELSSSSIWFSLIFFLYQFTDENIIVFYMQNYWSRSSYETASAVGQMKLYHCLRYTHRHQHVGSNHCSCCSLSSRDLGQTIAFRHLASAKFGILNYYHSHIPPDKAFSWNTCVCPCLRLLDFLIG